MLRNKRFKRKVISRLNKPKESDCENTFLQEIPHNPEIDTNMREEIEIRYKLSHVNNNYVFLRDKATNNQSVKKRRTVASPTLLFSETTSPLIMSPTLNRLKCCKTPSNALLNVLKKKKTEEINSIFTKKKRKVTKKNRLGSTKKFNTQTFTRHKYSYSLGTFSKKSNNPSTR